MSSETDDDTIFQEVSDYYRDEHIRDMFKEYLKRLMLHKPDDPIAFLQKQVKTDPYVHPLAPSTTVQNAIYYQRLDYKNPKLFSTMISKMERYKDCDIWLDLISADEIASLNASIQDYSASSIVIQNFLSRYCFPIEVLDPMFLFFQKAAALKMHVHALDENDIALFPYTAEEKNDTERISSIMERVSDQSTSKWIRKIHHFHGLKVRPQVICAGVEHVPHLNNPSLGYISETVNKLKVSYGPCIDEYISVVERMKSTVSEDNELYVQEALEYLKTMRNFGSPPAITL